MITIVAGGLLLREAIVLRAPTAQAGVPVLLETSPQRLKPDDQEFFGTAEAVPSRLPLRIKNAGAA